MGSVTGYSKAKVDALLAAAAAATATPVTPPITKSGNKLQINGVNKRFSGANAYWLGLDDNGSGTSAGAYPTHDQINWAFEGMQTMGHNLCRAHTIGMSAGLAKSFETAPGTFVGANLEAADWAIYQAKKRGIYLMVPLTDMHNYYHGGKGVFVHWAYQQNSSGLTDVPNPGNLFNGGSGKDSNVEQQFYGNTTATLRIYALFQDFISHWLNHVNPYTGLAYKDDPTIAIIETGNELYDATSEWTDRVAAYIKSIAPNKLVADGSAATGLTVANAKGLSSSNIDIVGSHYYVYNADYSSAIGFTVAPSQYGSSTTALQQLATDVTTAKNAGKVFILGEYPWTRADVSSLYAAVEANADISADLYWAYIANAPDGTPETHGGSLGGDDYSLHRKYSNANEIALGPALASHIGRMSGIPA